jgi:hypothetical protein
MKTLILTGSDNKMFDLLDLTLKSKIEYCTKHGYDLMVKKQWSDITELNFSAEKNIGFVRVFTAFQMLSIYDLVVWIDADAFITNFDYKIEDIANSDHCFFVSRDWVFDKDDINGTFNSGNFILKKTSQIESFFQSFAQVSQSYLNHVMQDQQALNHLYLSGMQSRNMKIVDKKYLNSVPELMFETETWKGRRPIANPWTKDCFIAHLTGALNEERIKVFNKMQSI